VMRANVHLNKLKLDLPGEHRQGLGRFDIYVGQ